MHFEAPTVLDRIETDPQEEFFSEVPSFSEEEPRAATLFSQREQDWEMEEMKEGADTIRPNNFKKTREESQSE